MDLDTNDLLIEIQNELMLLKRLIMSKTLSQKGDMALVECDGVIFFAKRENNNVVSFQKYDIMSRCWINEVNPN